MGITNVLKLVIVTKVSPRENLKLKIVYLPY